MLTGLDELKIKSTRQNTRICDIDLQISELNKQNHVLTHLRSKGYMDSAIFIEKTNALNGKINALRSERSRLLNDDDDTTIADTERLLEILADGPQQLDSFDEMMFSSIVDKMVVNSRETVVFRLLNGLELTEILEVQARKKYLLS